MFQRYISGINGVAVFFGKKGNFYSSWSGLDKKERFFLRNNNSSYFSDFKASLEVGNLLSLFSSRAGELLDMIGARNVLIEFVVSRGRLFIVQAQPYAGRFPVNLYVRFENEANYNFNALDMEDIFLKEFSKRIGLSNFPDFHIKREGIFLELAEILEMEKEISLRVKNDAFLTSFKKTCLDIMKSTLSSVSGEKEIEKYITALKKLNAEMAVMNFVLTRISASLWRINKSQNICLDFANFSFSLKKYYNSATSIISDKILSMTYGLNHDRLSKICRIPYDDALLCISGKKTLVFKQDKPEKHDFILHPLYPVKGIELSPGNAEGIVRIVRNSDDAQKCQENEIAVSPYMDRSMVSAVIRSRGVITSVGNFFSHAAILAREMKKPCVGAIAACDRIFSNGDRVAIKRGLIFKL